MLQNGWNVKDYVPIMTFLNVHSILSYSERREKKRWFFIYTHFFCWPITGFFCPRLVFFIWKTLLILCFLSILLNATSVDGKNGELIFLQEFVFWVMGWGILWEQSRPICKKEVVSFFSLRFVLSLYWFFLLFRFCSQQPTGLRFVFEGRLRECQFSVCELLFFCAMFLVSRKLIDYELIHLIN